MWVTHPDLVYEEPDKEYIDDWLTMSRAKQISKWTGSTVIDVVERMNSNDLQTRNVINRISDYMDIYTDVQTELTKQGALNGRS